MYTIVACTNNIVYIMQPFNGYKVQYKKYKCVNINFIEDQTFCTVGVISEVLNLH